MRVIAGKARHLNLETLPGLSTRPTTDRIKETLFNILQSTVPGSVFLDLFAGSGGIGIEALSRGAAKAFFVDNNRKACEVIRKNLSFTRLSNEGTVLCADAVGALRSLEGRVVFDCIFMDPPYKDALEKDVMSYLEESSLVTPDTLIIIEASKDTDFSWLCDMGFEMIRCKEYKTNKHVFARRAERG